MKKIIVVSLVSAFIFTAGITSVYAIGTGHSNNHYNFIDTDSDGYCDNDGNRTSNINNEKHCGRNR